MSVKELLPIGSVVRLKDAKKDLMIIGIKVQDANDVDYDYISVMYPEGYISREIFFKFNHDNIEKIYAEGFKSEVRDKFIEKVERTLENSVDVNNENI